MGTENSIVKFFYNIIPGYYFLFLLQSFEIIRSINFPFIANTDNSIIIGTSIIILSLFLGYMLQAITVFFRQDRGWEERQFKKTEEENEKYGIAFKSLFVKETDKNTKKQFFHLMDCSLRSQEASFLPTHFSSLFAFWSNIFFASCIALIIIAIRFSLDPIVCADRISSIIYLFIFIPVSWFFADKFLYSYYDVILNCYYMTILNGNKAEKQKAKK